MPSPAPSSSPLFTYLGYGGAVILLIAVSVLFSTLSFPPSQLAPYVNHLFREQRLISSNDNDNNHQQQQQYLDHEVVAEQERQRQELNRPTEEQQLPSDQQQKPAAATSSLLHHDDDPHQQQECGVYLATSTIPGAGFGMFAGRDYRNGEHIHTYGDIVIPTVDLHAHVGHQDFPWLWDEYVSTR